MFNCARLAALMRSTPRVTCFLPNKGGRHPLQGWAGLCQECPLSSGDDARVDVFEQGPTPPACLVKEWRLPPTARRNSAPAGAPGPGRAAKQRTRAPVMDKTARTVIEYVCD